MEKDIRILMVDDDQEDRFIIQQAFDDLKYPSVLHFEQNGEDALAYLQQSTRENSLPCLIVLDLNMPRMNGTQTLRTLKNDPVLSSIPVVIYSTSLNSIEKEECLQLGAISYVIKPISFDQSREIVKEFYTLCLK